MEILFCDECGARITAQTGAAGEKKLCEACLAKQRAVKPSNRQLQPARARSERLISPAQHAPSAHRPGPRAAADTARIRGAQTNGSPMVIVGIVVVALLAVGAVLFFKSGEPTRTASTPQAPTLKTPSASTPTPPRSQSTDTPEASRTAAAGSPGTTLPAPSRNTAKAAEEAFETLERFEGLAPEDREGRIRRIEAFLAAHGQEIVASRARVMLRQLQAPPPPPTPPKPPSPEPAQPVTPDPAPSMEGWKAVSGPFTFEDGQLNRWDGDLGSRVDVGEFEGRKCLRLRPGDQLNCRAFRGPSMDSSGVRVRFRYFAHDVDYVELLWAQGSHRPRKHIEPLVRDAWTEACFVGAEMGGNADRLRHVEIGGPAKSAESFLLLDDVVWEKQ